MKKRLFYIALIAILLSCNRGVWLSQYIYRPKHPKFTIKKTDFVANDLIKNTHLYVSTKKYISDGKQRVLYNFTGFYADGRMIGSSCDDTTLYRIYNANSWQSAGCIGYYTTKEDKIIIEYFIPGNGGHNETVYGVIKKDTIILSEPVYLLFKKDIWNDTLVKSVYALQ